MTKLKQYFPMIRTREEILSEISEKNSLAKAFHTLAPESQQEFLGFCSGAKGVKILYDSFFKEIMNAEYSPNRLEDFLSQLLKQKVRIKFVLPADSTRIADESSLLITDIVVELEDGSLANIEVQKIGYRFPGQRCACYSSDLLLRQYKRVRDKNKKLFSYKDIKNVYTIILFENSPAEFKEYPDNYVHTFKQKSDTGVELPLLQEYIFIPLDIFKEIYHNKPISNKLDCWLAFFCFDDPEDIIRLIEAHPEFKPMYTDIYNMCLNMEGVLNMFSEELAILDRNTVRYMCEEMQEEINQQKKELEETYSILSEQKATLEKTIAEKKKILVENEKSLAEHKKALSESEKALSENEKALSESEKALSENEKALAENKKALAEHKKALAESEKALAEQKAESEKSLVESEKALSEQKAENERLMQILKEHNIEIN